MHVCVVSVVCRMTVGAHWWSLDTEPTRATSQVAKVFFFLPIYVFVAFGKNKYPFFSSSLLDLC